MGSVVIDFSELDSFSKEIYSMGANFPKKQKKFLEKQGEHLRHATVSESKRHGKRINKLTQKSTKNGKVYKYKGAKSIRVYSNAPHMHLIENGHRMVTHDGREVGFVSGKHVFEKAAKKFEPHFVDEVSKMIEKEFDKL